jgi:hypothetical protein
MVVLPAGYAIVAARAIDASGLALAVAALTVTLSARAIFTSCAPGEAARDGWLFIGGLRSRFGGEA